MKHHKAQGSLQKKISDLMALPPSIHSLQTNGSAEEDEEGHKEDLFFVPKPKEQEPLKHIKLNVVLDDIWARAHVSEKDGGVKRTKKLAFKGTLFVRFFLYA